MSKLLIIKTNFYTDEALLKRRGYKIIQVKHVYWSRTIELFLIKRVLLMVTNLMKVVIT